MNLKIIINPVARRGKAAAWIPTLEQWGGHSALMIARRPGQAQALGKQAVSEGAHTVIAAGGDGTINEIINGIRGASCHLGVLPLGTMNVFAREIALPYRDIEECWRCIVRGRTKGVDLFQANGRLFIQMAGVGLDAKCIKELSPRLKRWLGAAGYVWRSLTLLRQKWPRLHLTTSGSEQAIGQTILIGNGRFYGGSIPLFPKADCQDGLLDVLILHDLRLRTLLPLLERSVSPSAPSLPSSVHYLQTPDLEDTSSAPDDFEVDGEWVGQTPLVIKPFPEPLSVLY